MLAWKWNFFSILNLNPKVISQFVKKTGLSQRSIEIKKHFREGMERSFIPAPFRNFIVWSTPRGFGG